jgi:hypothetical protein
MFSALHSNSRSTEVSYGTVGRRVLKSEKT